MKKLVLESTSGMLEETDSALDLVDMDVQARGARGRLK